MRHRLSISIPRLGKALGLASGAGLRSGGKGTLPGLSGPALRTLQAPYQVLDHRHPARLPCFEHPSSMRKPGRFPRLEHQRT